MKRYLICVVCCCSLLAVKAQDASARKFQFHSLTSFGLINGSNATSGSLQVVNGFSRQNWFAGAGIGIDYYQYRTIPVFADLRYEWGKKKTRAFVYADGGINLQWVQDEFKNTEWGWNGPINNGFKNGFYSDMGIGINAGMKNGNAIIVSLGYSRKTMKETLKHQDWRTLLIQTDINTYRFNRVVFKLGFRFW